jgi:uncharacterized protein (UPF0332 family)
MPAFPCDGYMALADVLLSTPDESAQRSAASRAYYSVYHFAREWLEGQGVSVPQEGAHTFVWIEVRQRRAALGRLGFRLRDNRNQADYDSPLRHVDLLAQSTVNDAKALQAQIQAVVI